MNSNSNNFREMFWDESNRLRVVNDNDHQIQHYIYDGAGERILKASSQIETVYENGQVDANTTTMGLYTTYVSPYMVVDANQKYSKHYFNGTQRVASKIGEQDIAIFENGNQYLKQSNSKATENTPATDFDALKNKQITDFSYYLSKSTNNATAKNVKVNYTEYKKVDTNTETTSAKTADNNSAFAAPQYAEIYYYHSDHLGTGTFLSDFDGNPYQFFLNLPFGETMAEQHSYSGEYTNRYKFNGKELDEETGFYYYGARYYNPKFSIWLSTDPLAEEFPNWNPYNYCMQNPINLIDHDGRAPKPPKLNAITNVLNVLKGKSWVKYNSDIITTFLGFELSRDKGECAEYSRLQVEKGGDYTAVGAKKRVDMYIDSRQDDKKQYNLQNGINTIVENLKEGKAVMAGVMYDAEKNTGNPNESTNHFVTIVGMGKDEKGNSYFSYYDNFTGGKGEKVGTDTVLNRFTLQVDSKGNYYFADADNNIPYNGNKEVKLENKENKPARYILTEVRDNE